MRWPASICAVLLCAALAPAPLAQARVQVAPGMEIQLSSGSACTLGFLAGNDAGKRLAVTAGHCADGPGEGVYTKNGGLIGEVVAHYPDSENIAEGFGVTVLELDSRVEIADGFFTRYGNPRPGDAVAKYGSTTAGTEGEITSVDVDEEFPRYSVMRSTLLAEHGDSGSPWFADTDAGPMLYGITIGHFADPDSGATRGAYGFPIDSLVAYVRQASPEWGAGFMPGS